MEPLTQRPPRFGVGRATGFTLIEILIALAIAAILSATLAVLALPDDAARAHGEARRLATLLEMAATEARATGQSLAWSPEPRGYAFFRRDADGNWARISEAGVYQPHSLGEHTALRSVLVDSRELPRGGLIALSPYGSQALIEATIAGGNARFILRGGILGRISLQREIDDGQTGTATRIHAG